MMLSISENTGQPIKVFNNGNMVRDFTYIDDIIEGVVRVIDNLPAKRPLEARVPERGTTEGTLPSKHSADSEESSPLPLCHMTLRKVVFIFVL